MNGKTTTYLSPGLIIALCFSPLLLAGCGHSGSGAEPGSNGESVAAKAPIGAINPGKGEHQSDDQFTAVSPNNSANLGLNYKVFEFAPDGSWINAVPMAPGSKAGPVVVQVNRAGNYLVRMENPKCAYPVQATPGQGPGFTLTSAAPEHAVQMPAKTQLTLVMGESAKNNYSCNIVVSTAGS